MKKIIGNILSLIIVFTMVSCQDDSFKLDYKAPLTIEFTGVETSNIVTVDKGVLSYTAKIDIKSTAAGVKLFEIYNADIKTGDKGSLIAGTSKTFDNEGVATYNVEFVVDNLVQSRCIKVIATDADGNTFERNLFVKITPAVAFSQSLKIETAEDYYGPYFASWLDGRVYMRSNGEAYKNEIDFSLGNVVIESEGATAVPALVNPAERTKYGLLTIAGLQQTKFELTTLTKAQYDAVGQVDITPVSTLANPDKDAVKLVNGKVYVFKTANGKKGLIYISALTAKTGTIESTTGEWIANTAYHQATLTTKVIKE